MRRFIAAESVLLRDQSDMLRAQMSDLSSAVLCLDTKKSSVSQTPALVTTTLIFQMPRCSLATVLRDL